MTTIIFAKQALTSEGWENNVLVEVDSAGRIACISKVGKETPVERKATEQVGVLLPALSNLHSHSFQRAMAGLAETKGSREEDDFWTWRKVMYRFLEMLTPDDIEAIAAYTQMEMLESGYAASAEFHYLHNAPNGAQYDAIDELSECLYQASLISGIGYTHLPVLYMQGGLNGQALQGGQLRFGNSIDSFETLYAKLLSRQKELPTDFVLGVAPHSLRAVTLDGLRYTNQLNNKTPIHIHAAEQVHEVRDVLSALGKRPVQWLLNNMAIDHRWCLIHATHLDAAEITQLAKSNAIAGLCPITEANLGDGIFNATDYLKQGGRFGIGSDSNVKIALSEELRALEVSQRLRDKRRVILCDHNTRSNGRFLYERAATGGAQALGRNSGKIDVGALADFVALDDTHAAITELTHDTVLDTWIFASDDRIVSDVWSAGRHVVKGGVHQRHDQISNRFYKTIQRLRKNL